MTIGIVGSPKGSKEQLGRVSVRAKKDGRMDMITTKPQELCRLLETATRTIKNIALVPQTDTDLFVAGVGKRLRALRKQDTNIIISFFGRDETLRTDRVRIYTPAKNKGGRKHFATVRVR